MLIDEFDQFAGKGRVVVAVGVPDSFQVADLFFLKRSAEAVAEFLGRMNLLAGLAISVGGGFLDGIGFVSLQNFSFAFLSAALSDSMVGPMPAIWLGSILTAGKLFLRKFSHFAKGQHVLEGG